MAVFQCAPLPARPRPTNAPHVAGRAPVAPLGHARRPLNNSRGLLAFARSLFRIIIDGALARARVRPAPPLHRGRRARFKHLSTDTKLNLHSVSARSKPLAHAEVLVIGIEINRPLEGTLRQDGESREPIGVYSSKINVMFKSSYTQCRSCRSSDTRMRIAGCYMFVQLTFLGVEFLVETKPTSPEAMRAAAVEAPADAAGLAAPTVPSSGIARVDRPHGHVAKKTSACVHLVARDGFPNTRSFPVAPKGYSTWQRKLRRDQAELSADSFCFVSVSAEGTAGAGGRGRLRLCKCEAPPRPAPRTRASYVLDIIDFSLSF
ncbi:hypothetical protein EVAR_51522_1 [Eumeta japonica]|uniref:Uncharacterized protein n=1 Tax=Eumeta variegata TaxID=151549 RepID=A0A4C1XF72_EUMVA|nr:hypothetical protein EVAR_51522_1 [Eumeta japonica]